MKCVEVTRQNKSAITFRSAGILWAQLITSINIETPMFEGTLWHAEWRRGISGCWRCGVVWCGSVWCGMAWCGAVCGVWHVACDVCGP